MDDNWRSKGCEASSLFTNIDPDILREDVAVLFAKDCNSVVLPQPLHLLVMTGLDECQAHWHLPWTHDSEQLSGPNFAICLIHYNPLVVRGGDPTPFEAAYVFINKRAKGILLFSVRRLDHDMF